MAYVHATTTVGTTPTLIASIAGAGVGGVTVSSSAACFVGGSTVASSGANQGLPIPATTPVNLPTAGGSSSPLYAVVASGTASVSVLYAED